MDTSALTPRQAEVWHAILAHVEETGLLPSLRELCARLGIGSVNGVVCHLTALERKGWLERRHGTRDGAAPVVSRTICPAGLRDRIRAAAAEIRTASAATSPSTTAPTTSAGP